MSSLANPTLSSHQDLDSGTNIAAVPGRDKLFGVLYMPWHCPSFQENGDYVVLSDNFKAAGISGLQEKVDYFRSDVVNNTHKWAGRGGWSWWDRPLLGPYCLINNEKVLTQHAKWLKSAGIDFVVIDSSNHPNVADLEAGNQILKPFESILKVWSKIPGAPKVIPWAPFQNMASLDEKGNAIGGAGSSKVLAMVDAFANLLKGQYPEMRMPYKGKYLLGWVDDSYKDAEGNVKGRYSDMTTQSSTFERLRSDWHIFKMWGLNNTSGTSEWSFLAPCGNEADFRKSLGFKACDQFSSKSQVSVAVAYQSSFAPRETMTRKFYGRTFVQQFAEVYRNQEADFVLFSTWNEWIAQAQYGEHTKNASGSSQWEFTDQFDAERNRDLEPGGPTGDYYYRLMTKLIKDYRAGNEFKNDNYFFTKRSLFNPVYYMNKYPLAKQEVGNDKEKLFAHFISLGIKLGYSPNPFFDFKFYKTFNNLHSMDNHTLLNHFIADGVYEGRRAAERFDARTYLAANPDLIKAFGSFSVKDAIDHYNRFGYKETNRPRIIQRKPDGFGGAWGKCYFKIAGDQGWRKMNRKESYVKNCKEAFLNGDAKAMMMNNAKGTLSPVPFIATRP